MEVTVIVRFKNKSLRDARREKGLTVKALHEMTGISIGTLYEYEGFKSYPGPSTKIKKDRLRKLEEVLCLPLEYLFSDEYREAVDRRMGLPLETDFAMKELPEWAERPYLLPAPEQQVDLDELKRALEESLHLLTEREADVLRLLYGLKDGREYTLDEIGQKYKRSRERIRQIEAKALRKLKHPSRLPSLRAFLQGEASQ